MGASPKVSIIIPTYNRASLLPVAIDSVLAQDHSDSELIVVDDGSTDQTADLLKSYGSSLRLIRQENRGASAARNAGIKAAKYGLLAFLDSDDRFAPNKLTLQMQAMQENPHYLVSHTQEIWYRNGKLLNQKIKHRKESGDLFSRCLELCAVGMSTIMARQELFETVGLFDEDLPCCEDYDLWLRTSVEHHFLLVDHPLTIKEGGRPDQLSRQYQVGMDRFRIQAIGKLLDSGGLDLEHERLARKELVRKCRIYGTGCLKHGRQAEGEKYLEMAAQYAE